MIWRYPYFRKPPYGIIIARIVGVRTHLRTTNPPIKHPILMDRNMCQARIKPWFLQGVQYERGKGFMGI